MDFDRTLQLIEEIVEGQQKKLLSCGTRIVPGVTSDDLLQPNDFPELENHPVFRYEEGVLEGVRTVYTALLAENAEGILS
jgi:hypothetical protein